MFDAEIFDARKFITFKLPLGQRSEVLFMLGSVGTANGLHGCAGAWLVQTFTYSLILILIVTSTYKPVFACR